ncbi:MAG TPA: hypothetical protein VEY09_19945 [Pyrinomonadaceae bacterium]|nr:hypothetical protein [Pyrinomonadaceae bacterium]
MSHRKLRSVLLTLLATSSVCFAQQPAPASKSPAPKKTARGAEADPLDEARRAAAVSLVNSLAEEARNFSDPVLRATAQARAADALWDVERDRARALFRRAWEAAEVADRELGEKRAREASRRGAPSSRDAGSVRREVLRLAARRESALGSEFLTRLDAANKEETEARTPSAPAATDGPAATPKIDPDNPPSHMTQRLNLARQLLEDGEVERALLFADPALYPVNTFGMAFLDVLREKDPKAADQRYAGLLQRAASDPAADANSVSLLSAYALTPFLYITVRPDGGSHTRQFRGNVRLPENFDPRIRTAFLGAAAQILLRPTPPAEQDASSSGRVGAYVVTARLAPVFEQYAHPAAPQIRARQSALLEHTPERSRTPDNSLLTRGLAPEPSAANQVQDLTASLDRAQTSAERDRIRFRLAMGLFEEDPEQSRDHASKIEDEEMRSQLLRALAFRSLETALRGKRAEEVARLARADLLTEVQRAYGLTEAANMIAKEQPGRAVEFLEEALAAARKIDPGSTERAQALTAVATRLHALDAARSWEMLGELVKAANQSAGFTGEEGGLLIQVRFRDGGAMTSNVGVESFNLSDLFAALAAEDLNRASEAARSLSHESARSAATLAVARSVLVKRREDSTRRAGASR